MSKRAQHSIFHYFLFQLPVNVATIYKINAQLFLTSR